MNGIRKTASIWIAAASLGMVGCLPPEQAKPPVPNPPPPAPVPVEMETVKADVGVGAKGRSLDEYKNKPQAIIAQPAISFFAAKEKIAFEIAVPQAMALFQATEGRFPNDHQEFMERIVKENAIALPVLPKGHEYQYDPETHQLMVFRPKADAAAPPAE